MVTSTPVHPEGPRYGVSLAYLAGVWTRPLLWRPAAQYLAHRGWAGLLVDTSTVTGGIAARAAAVTDHLRKLPAMPVLIGHDAGALVALASAARAEFAAVVLVSPLRPGAPGTQALAWSRGLPWALVRRRPVDPPGGVTGRAFLADRPPDIVATPEDPRLLSELARRTPVPRPARMPPALVLHGARDPFLSSDEARGFATDLGADFVELEGLGHWVPAAPVWQRAGDQVHRWLVQRLGETNLELYAEAMADRDAEE
jgi:predicted alpha/beta hydrolase family esterase